MTYTHGETTAAAEEIAHRFTIAQQRAVDLQAALKLQQLEEANTRTAAALQASEERTRQALAVLQERKAVTYPVDPFWRQNRAVLDRELAAYDRGQRLKAAQQRTKVPTAALQGVVGVVAHPDQTGAAERHTAPRRLRAVS